MNIINSIKAAYKRHRLRQEAKDKLGEVILTPYGYIQKSNEIDCIVHGHKWTSSFDPKSELQKPIKNRVYCKHCRVYYHEHKYHELNYEP